MFHFQNKQNRGRVLQSLFVQFMGAPPSAKLDWLVLVSATCGAAKGEEACSKASETAEALEKPPKLDTFSSNARILRKWKSTSSKSSNSTDSSSSPSSCGVTLTALLLLLASVLL